MVVKKVRVDNFDNETPADTIEFALEGAKFRIDLGPVNAEKLRNALQPFIAVAEQIGSRSASVNGNGQDKKQYYQAVRMWAKENAEELMERGLQVAERGRIKKEVLDLFEETRQPATVG